MSLRLRLFRSALVFFICMTLCILSAMRQAAAQNIIAAGSGIIINDSAVLSNHHVLKGCSSIRVHNDKFDANTGNLYFSEDRVLDLGIALFPRAAFKAAIQLNPQNLSLCEAIYTLGCPLGYAMTDSIKYTSGETSSFSNSVNFLHSAITDHGSSGSGVFDKNSDYLIGLNTAMYE